MMKNSIKRFLTVSCIAVMLLTVLGITVPADEVQGEEFVGTEAASQWTVGDNVTVKKMPSGDGYSLSFEFSDGTLWSNWHQLFQR